MHICFIEDTPSYGGGQEWMVDTISEFIRLKHEVSVIVPEENISLINKCKSDGAVVFTYSWKDIPNHRKVYKKNWVECLKTADIAICSVHPPRKKFHCIKFAATCIKKAGNKTVLIPKTGTIVPHYLREYYLPDPKIQVDIVTITAFTRQYLVDHYKIPEKLIKVIYQGTNIDKFNKNVHTSVESKKLYPLPEKASPVLGVIGKYEERKGHKILLKAVKMLKKTSLPDITVMFVGDGPLEKKLKKQVAKMKLETNVHFFPFTDTPNYVYERLDMLILPSLYKEGLPNVLLEAMAMGVPCIASKIAGTAEIVLDDKTGYLVEPGNDEELASRILELWSDKVRLKDFGEASKKMIVTRFNRKFQAVKYSQYLTKVLENKKNVENAQNLKS
jgi:glycosyltransferase involved in cell wall biosynthesis